MAPIQKIIVLVTAMAMFARMAHVGVGLHLIAQLAMRATQLRISVLPLVVQLSCATADVAREAPVCPVHRALPAAALARSVLHARAERRPAPPEYASEEADHED